METRVRNVVQAPISPILVRCEKLTCSDWFCNTILRIPQYLLLTYARSVKLHICVRKYYLYWFNAIKLFGAKGGGGWGCLLFWNFLSYLALKTKEYGILDNLWMYVITTGLLLSVLQLWSVVEEENDVCKSHIDSTHFLCNFQTNCLPCPMGTYQTNTGQTSCFECWLGTSSTAVGATTPNVCVACNPGSYSAEAGNAQCTECEQGRYQPLGGQVSCMPCARGTHQGSSGATMCVDCPQGQYQNAEGSTTCLECDAGHHAPDEGSQECEPCAEGYYAPSQGAISCSPCIQGWYQDEPGQSQVNYCCFLLQIYTSYLFRVKSHLQERDYRNLDLDLVQCRLSLLLIIFKWLSDHLHKIWIK